MENEGARRGRTFLKIMGVLLAIGAVCFVVVKIYRKFFPKQQPVLEGDAEDLDVIEAADAPVAKAEPAKAETFEVPAGAVIANADQMEA